ncbi:tetratricopeptide repeat protein [Flavisolibacter nicotianae]|uniref:tetratricopeptide repeat protein n=1 Tax=Flavisolibacter nicotianae TaxID=2364882 RepID=UPI000EAC3B93|nr:tetratricopeptide repeat protein [Flavisolibacter nicotianae]
METESTLFELQKRIDDLNARAWEIRVNDSGKAFSMGKEAAELSRQAGYKKGLAEGLRTYGFGLIRLSKHKEAKAVLDEAFVLFAEMGDNRGLSEVHEYFGIIHRSFGNFDASLENLFKALDICTRTNYLEEASLACYHLGVTYKYMGSYEKAIHYLLEGLKTAREIGHWVAESYALNLIGQIYFETGDYQQAIAYYQQSLQIRRSSGDQWGEAGCLDNIGFTYYKIGAYEQAIEMCTQSLGICQCTSDKKGIANTLFHLSQVYHKQGRTEKALATANESLQIRKDINDKRGQAEALLFLSQLSLCSFPARQTALVFLNEAFLLANEIKAQDLLANVHFHYYTTYKKLEQFEQALASLETYNQIERELHKDALAEKVINLQISHRIEQTKQEAENLRLQNEELAALYEELKKQKEETDNQRKIAEDSLVQLKETQAQLIQREKMASLGELTAGIAHEIQNPLNFVNNFSELNLELITEMKDGLQQGRSEDAVAMADDIQQNLEKVSYHGRRADAIVKNMLQHSRKSTGQREPTDINVLADEYLRLSYHGMRAKDKAFNATIETDFAAVIGKVNVIPQDIGRVLLNLFNNAFYEIYKKKKQLREGFEPTIWVSTKKCVNAIEIIVRDNGKGIPQKALAKIFQPFFTTKPTGEGTGLGLSLSYDIITKGHGGALLVETQEGEGTTFIVQLPAPASVDKHE